MQHATIGDLVVGGFVFKAFLYHVANNKQKQLAQKRMVVADHFWGQLNTVLGRAQTAASAEAQTAKFQQRP